ncbi:MAG: histidinol-phosphate transaminase [Desulfosudaceae bacterium]
MDINPPDFVMSVQPYAPGKPIEELKREYGIADVIKLASNENPLGPSPLAVQAMQEAVAALHRYPDGSGYYLVKKLADILKVAPANIVLGNGSDEIIGMLGRALLRAGDEVIMNDPSFSMYAIMARLSEAVPVSVPLTSLAVDLDRIKAAVTPRTRMIFLTNPHNPTGSALTDDQLESFLRDIPANVLVVVDEAYAEFAGEGCCADSRRFFDNQRLLVTLRTFSKAYGLAGLRVGYGIMPEELAGFLNRVRQPFNVNSLAQAAALAALDDNEFLALTRQMVRQGLDYLTASLEEMGIACFPTQANFLLIDVKTDADQIFEKLLEQGVIVRSMVSYGYPDYLRITAGLPLENERFVEALRKVLS